MGRCEVNTRLRARRVALALAGLVLAAVMLHTVLGGRELSGAAARLAHPAVGWVLVAIGCEACSYLLYATAQRRLLERTGRHLGVGWLASLAVSAQALSNFLPAGYLAANVLNFRQLRRRGLSAASTGWLLVRTSALYIGVLAALTVIGGEIAGGRGGPGMDGVRIGADAVLGVLVAVCAAVALALRDRRVRRLVHERLKAPSLRPRTAVAAGVVFTAGWLADAACLVAGLHATGAAVPWGLLLLAYCAAQLVSFLPVTPGGLGLVEGSLTFVLLAGGGSGGRVLAGVLLYRIVSYWGTLPAGGLGYWLVCRNQGPAAEAAAMPSISLSPDAERRAPTSRDRAAGGDRPVVVLGG